MDPQKALEAWSTITMLVENDWGEKGTGFLVKLNIVQKGINYVKFFLASCKHVLNKDAQRRNEAEEITLFPLVRQVDHSLQREERTLTLRREHGAKIWGIHPNPEVDVIVFDVSELIFQGMRIEHDAPDAKILVNAEWVKKLGIKPDDEVVIIGFPDIERLKTSRPVYRAGTISTPLGERVQFRREAEIHSLPAFLVDGQTIPGSSGSPVLLRPTIGRIIDGKNYFTMTVPPLLLGILAETTFAEVEYGSFKGWTFSGMGVAFDADSITETILHYMDNLIAAR